MRVILASTSRYRRELLSRLGIAFEGVSPPFDEDAAKAKHSHLPPAQLSLELARGKARSVSERDPDALVIGSDQIAVMDGERLSKPKTVERAEAQLAKLSGKTHQLVTAVVIAHGASGREVEAVDVHTLTMRVLGKEAIADYVRRDRPLDCAGSYRVESLGIALFEKVSGDDFTGVIGLPLTKVAALLSELGLDVLG